MVRILFLWLMFLAISLSKEDYSEDYKSNYDDERHIFHCYKDSTENFVPLLQRLRRLSFIMLTIIKQKLICLEALRIMGKSKMDTAIPFNYPISSL